MLISAISQNRNSNYNLSTNANTYSTRGNETIGDTVFNSLIPSVSNKKTDVLFNNINEWKNFCHRQILGEKLDIQV